MSNTEDISIKYLKKDLLFFLIVFIVFVAIVAGLYVWDRNANILQNITDQILAYFSIKL